MQIIEIKDIQDSLLKVEKVSVVGWVKSNRDSGKIAFIELNDGSTLTNLQVVYKAQQTAGFDQAKTVRTGGAVYVEGKIKKNKNNSEQWEIIANEIKVLKQADEDYPLQKKQHSLEFLRDNAHLRVRTNTLMTVMRVRNQLAMSIHKFFQNNGFIWVSSPIITASDAEGAGENFEIKQNDDKPFFDKKPSLTVSGQFGAEAYAQAFKKVYTFGPTFRAEHSHTNRHLAEFWMVEPEIAFIDLKQLMMLIETFIKTIIAEILKKCVDEIKQVSVTKPQIKNRLEQLLKKDFVRCEYAQAIELLSKAKSQGVHFEDSEFFFGKDLASEHERYLCEKVFQSPVFLFNFPQEIKAFYMKVNPDNKTVAACDLLVPDVGEIVGGSQREDNYDKLKSRCELAKIDVSSLQWYLDLRRYGYYSSAGFGLGFERLLMYILDLENIKDAIPFPRTEGSLHY